MHLPDPCGTGAGLSQACARTPLLFGADGSCTPVLAVPPAFVRAEVCHNVDFTLDFWRTTAGLFHGAAFRAAERYTVSCCCSDQVSAARPGSLVTPRRVILARSGAPSPRGSVGRCTFRRSGLIAGPRQRTSTPSFAGTCSGAWNGWFRRNGDGRCR